MIWLIGASQVAHDEGDVDPVYLAQMREQMSRFLRIEAQPVHACIEMQGSGQGTTCDLSLTRPFDDLGKTA